MFNFNILMISFLFVFQAHADVTVRNSIRETLFGKSSANPMNKVKKSLYPDGSDLDDAGIIEDDYDPFESGVPCLVCLGNTNNVATRRGGVPAAAGNTNISDISTALIRGGFDNYSNSPAVTTLIASARQNLRDNPGRYIERLPGKKKKTFCYRAVKDALHDAKMVPSVYNGSNMARNGVTDLKGVGFKNLLDDARYASVLANKPVLAPKGSILVYDTPPRSTANIAGHIEIKTEHSGTEGYISISESRRPTYGYAIPAQRRLIGVMVK